MSKDSNINRNWYKVLTQCLIILIQSLTTLRKSSTFTSQ